MIKEISKFYLYLAVIGLVLCSSACTHKKQHVLPFVGNYDIVYTRVDGKERQDTIYPKVPAFTYWNEDSVKIHSSSFKGKLWIVDFFFTSCPTICPVMTTNLRKVNHALAAFKSDVQFISFTINPDYDRPSVLRQYKKLHGITASNWTFLAGDEERTHQMGIENFQTFAGRDDEAEGGYVHSGAFTLVDKEGYVRGVYLGTDNKEVQRLIHDVKKLLSLEYGIN